ncbi:hypothetical protein Tco_0653309 [Tanacetum coccineum]|uniref:Uncharacterized protein n=1 Tax=Tanacetum coccineum TaxID=301880 RepID=A0ABQ4X0T8_9ASTR
MYMAVASLFCIIAMVADLIHGLKNKKLWFPYKYFTLNAASLNVIAVAMKLPMDLNNPTRGVRLDDKAQSMAFCDHDGTTLDLHMFRFNDSKFQRDIELKYQAVMRALRDLKPATIKKD